MITSEELVEVLDLLARMWPDRITKAIESLGSPADLLRAFDAFTVDELEAAARDMLLTRKRLFDSDNPIALLVEAANKAQTDQHGGVARQIGVPWSVGRDGRPGFLWPKDLEHFRGLHAAGKLEPEIVGRLIGAARYWEQSTTPCRACPRGPGHCHECRRDHDPVVCSAADRDLVSEHLETWLDAAFAAYQTALEAAAHAGKAERAKRGAARAPKPRVAGAPVAVGEVIAEIRPRLRSAMGATTQDVRR